MSASEYHGELAPAKHTRRKSEMVTALAEADTNEDFWPGIVARISDGEFISTIALELKVNHSILRNWIRGNKIREQEFMEADRAGKQARLERVLKKVHAAATEDIAEPTTRMEQLRAAEIYMKQHQPEDAPKNIANIEITFVAASDGKPVEKVIDQLP